MAPQCWQFQRNRTTVGLTGTLGRKTFIPVCPTLNSQTHGAEADVQRQMSRAWALQVYRPDGTLITIRMPS